MASFDHARVLFLIIGALCSGACSGATPEEGKGKSAADSDVASAKVAPTCAPRHEHFTDLGDLDPDQPNTTVALANNDQGTVVGFGVVSVSTGGKTSHAFRWKAETGLVDLGVLAGYGSYASDVNAHDEVVGSETLAGGLSQAVMWDARNGVHELGSLGDSINSYGRKINNRGQVLGEAQDASQIAHPFIWDAKTGMVALDLPRPALVTDMNDSGVVVGYWTAGDYPFVPFKWTADGGPVDLDVLGASSGAALSINDKGEIVGFLIIDDRRFPVKWTDCGAQRLSTIPGDLETIPYAISDQGWIVGDTSMLTSSTPPSTPRDQATEWDPTLRVGLLPLRAVQSSANDVNDCGDVTGNLWVEGCAQRAYLWEPERAAP